MTEPVETELVARLRETSWGADITDTLARWSHARVEAADEIERLQAELARVRKLGEAMAMKLDHMGTWIVKHANPGRELKYNTSPARAALAAWFAEAGR